jgi:hypothetical protein
MNEEDFKKSAVRSEDDKTVTYDLRPFKDQQRGAVAWYLGNLIFKSSVSSLNKSKSVLVLVDGQFESTSQLDGFIDKLKQQGLSIELRSDR